MGLIQQHNQNFSSSDMELTQDVKPQIDQQYSEQWQQQQLDAGYYQQTEPSVDYGQQTYQELDSQQKPEVNEAVPDQQQNYWGQTQSWEETTTTHPVQDETLQNNYWNNQQIDVSEMICLM